MGVGIVVSDFSTFHLQYNSNTTFFCQFKKSSYLCLRVLDELTVINILNMSKMNENTPWWVIVLKAIVYIIGLVLAGYGTGAAAQAMNIF